MAVSERQKIYNREWDRENMRTLSCRVRTKDYEIFKLYCKLNKTTPGKMIKSFVEKEIDSRYEELEAMLDNQQQIQPRKDEQYQ
ncbi:MAG: hypothetical protein IJ007_05215 [Oscillospiraceae bacterium]|nr:hypothetical protein [Oscillospiraceae bacterium]